jgi:hypothetical protein
MFVGQATSSVTEFEVTVIEENRSSASGSSGGSESVRRGGPFRKAKIVHTTASGRSATSRQQGTLRSTYIFGECFATAFTAQCTISTAKPTAKNKTKNVYQYCIKPERR